MRGPDTNPSRIPRDGYIAYSLKCLLSKWAQLASVHNGSLGTAYNYRNKWAPHFFGLTLQRIFKASNNFIIWGRSLFFLLYFKKYESSKGCKVRLKCQSGVISTFSCVKLRIVTDNSCRWYKDQQKSLNGGVGGGMKKRMLHITSRTLPVLWNKAFNKLLYLFQLQRLHL